VEMNDEIHTMLLRSLARDARWSTNFSVSFLSLSSRAEGRRRLNEKYFHFLMIGKLAKISFAGVSVSKVFLPIIKRLTRELIKSFDAQPTELQLVKSEMCKISLMKFSFEIIAS
jgi:hypothetical protein